MVLYGNVKSSVASFHSHAIWVCFRAVLHGELQGRGHSELQRVHFPPEIILTCVRWYVAYPLSMRYAEELLQEHGASVDHSTIAL
jgi:hypothetical protein